MGMPTISIAFQTDKPLREYGRLAQIAENYNFDGITVYNDLLYQPAWLPLLEIARATSRVRLGPAAVNPFTCHPINIAANMALIDEMSNGRSYLGFARGAWLDFVGLQLQNVPQQLREAMVWLDSQRAATFTRAAAGEMRAGTIQITFPSGVIPTTGDMIRPDSERHVVEELLWVQGSSRVTDASLRPRVSADQVPQARGVRKRERMLYAPSECEIEHVAYHHEGQLVSARPNHYQVDEDGRWTWHAGLGPQPGEAWSVRYLAPAAYVITDTMPAYRAEADEPMPHRATAIRFDRVKPEDLA